MREAQKDQTHEEQIKKINASHEQELNRVVSESKESMDKVRERSQNKFTVQEQQYQKDIENLKAMYQKKLAERESWSKAIFKVKHRLFNQVMLIKLKMTKLVKLPE